MIKMLVIEGDKDYEAANNLTPAKFQTHHIVEMLMCFLSSLDLDGSTKIIIRYSEPPDNESIYNCIKPMRISWIYVGAPRVNATDGLQDRDTCNLEIICNALKDIATINECESSVMDQIDSAAKTILECNFSMTLKVNKLTKFSPDRKYKAIVSRFLCPQGDKWLIEIKRKGCPALCGELSDGFKFIPLLHYYFKGEWIENQYCITDRFGKPVAIAFPDEKYLQLFSFKEPRKKVALTEK